MAPLGRLGASVVIPVGVAAESLTLSGKQSGQSRILPGDSKTPKEASPREPLLVLLGDGWRWDDDSLRNQKLATQLAKAQKANLVVRSATMPTCFSDGLATLGAGQRNQRSGTNALPPVLGTLLSEAQVELNTFGDESQRAVWGTTVANRATVHKSDSDYQGAAAKIFAELLKGVTQKDETGSPRRTAVFVDMTVFPREMQAAILVEILTQSQSLNWNTMMVSVSDNGQCTKDTQGDVIDVSGESYVPPKGPRLQAYAAVGPAFAGGAAYSGSTHHAGLVQTADVSATILEYFGVPVPENFKGVALHTQGDKSVDSLSSMARRAAIIRPAQYWFLPGFAGLLLTVLLGGVWSLHRRDRPLLESWEQPTELLARWRALGLFAALVPASAFWVNLFPWWELGPAQTEVAMREFAWFGGLLPFALAALVALLSTSFGLVSLFGPLSIISVYSLIIGFLDPFIASRMMLDSVIGTQSTWGGRFYGIDNMMFAIFLTSALMFSALIYGINNESKRRPLLIVLGIFATAVVAVDAAPSLGADFGGMLVSIPAFAWLFLRLEAKRIKPLLAAFIGLFTLIVAVVFVYVDWLRPLPERSHLGNFVDTVLRGEMWPVLRGKLTQLWTAGWPWWMIVAAITGFLFILAVMVWPLWRTWRNPYRRDYAWLRGRPAGSPVPLGLEWNRNETALAGAWFLAMVLGMALNDSSVLLGLTGFSVAAPAFLSLVAHKYLTKPTS